MGNRLTKDVNGQVDSHTYVTGTNRLQEITGPVAYIYDANGNITGIGSKVLTYNQNNRLILVEENSNILGEYTYNGEGQGVIKTAGGVTTVFHYDFNGNLIAESDETGNFVYEYLYKGGSRLALVDVASGEIFSFLNDRLGTPQMLADSTNTIVWEGIYKPFGEADVNPNSSVANNFRFPGQYYDNETGLHYNYHRYYDPQTGRYLTPDPIGLVGGINLFLYADGNPINATDLSGLTFDPLDLYDSSKTFMMPKLYSISSGVSWAGRDYSLTWWDKKSGLHLLPKVSTGISPTLVGIGIIKVTLEDSDRCESAREEPEIAVGWSKYLGIFTSVDMKRYGGSFGLGIGLPVTPSTSVSIEKARELLDPLADVGF